MSAVGDLRKCDELCPHCGGGVIEVYTFAPTGKTDNLGFGEEHVNQWVLRPHIPFECIRFLSEELADLRKKK